MSRPFFIDRSTRGLGIKHRPRDERCHIVVDRALAGMVRCTYKRLRRKGLDAIAARDAVYDLLFVGTVAAAYEPARRAADIEEAIARHARMVKQAISVWPYLRGLRVFEHRDRVLAHLCDSDRQYLTDIEGQLRPNAYDAAGIEIRAAWSSLHATEPLVAVGGAR